MTEKRKKPSQEEIDILLKKAELPSRKAMAWHPFYRGKIEIVPKCKIDSFSDFGVWYTPGVAAPCRAIEKGLKENNPESLYQHTNKGNFVAVVSDGTRVLGLGNIGPEAGMPVMEGKALLFKYLGGVDAFPICTSAHTADEIVQFCKWLQPTFGGINLEDLSQPKCFEVLDRLRADKELTIPVWHDDAQGTASITVAGVINAFKVTGRKLSEALFSFVGSGAANITISRLLVAAGVKPKNMVLVDSKGILHSSREDIDFLEKNYKQKHHFAMISNGEGRTGGIIDAMKGADIVIAASRPGPGIIKTEYIEKMATDPIVFACANPVPEIWPWEALAGGAKIVATGRSDFPNQVNNSLGFPGIFRGTLDVQATTITDEMTLAASYEIAKTAEDKGLKEDYIVPNMNDWEVFPREATTVALKAIEQGLARIKLSRDEIYQSALSRIKRSREQCQMLMKNGFIPPAPQIE